MPSSVALLGFDLRAVGERHAAVWAETRRRHFLLRGDAAPVLSVDVAAWPSLFDTGQGIGMDAAERERHGFAGLTPPAWTGASAGLWTDVEAMRRYAAAQPGWRAPAHAVIAIAWHRPQGVDGGPVGRGEVARMVVSLFLFAVFYNLAIDGRRARKALSE